MGAGVSGRSQQPVSPAVHSELMQKSSITEQQASSSMIRERQDVNAGTAGLLTVTSNADPSHASRSDLLSH